MRQIYFMVKRFTRKMVPETKKENKSHLVLCASDTFTRGGSRERQHLTPTAAVLVRDEEGGAETTRGHRVGHQRRQRTQRARLARASAVQLKVGHGARRLLRRRRAPQVEQHVVDANATAATGAARAAGDGERRRGRRLHRRRRRWQQAAARALLALRRRQPRRQQGLARARPADARWAAHALSRPPRSTTELATASEK